jgi:hypothetical protein
VAGVSLTKFAGKLSLAAGLRQGWLEIYSARAGASFINAPSGEGGAGSLLVGFLEHSLLEALDLVGFAYNHR